MWLAKVKPRRGLGSTQYGGDVRWAGTKSRRTTSGQGAVGNALLSDGAAMELETRRREPAGRFQRPLIAR